MVPSTYLIDVILITFYIYFYLTHIYLLALLLLPSFDIEISPKTLKAKLKQDFHTTAKKKYKIRIKFVLDEGLRGACFERRK